MRNLLLIVSVILLSIIGGCKPPSDSMPDLLNRADKLLTRDSLDSAFKLIDSAYKLDSLNVNVLALKSQYYTKSGRYDKAKYYVERGLSIDNMSSACWYAQGLMYLYKENEDVTYLLEARGCFEQAIALDSKNYKAFSDLGYYYIEKDKLDSALIFLMKSYKIDSTYIDALANIGYIYFNKEKYDKSIEFFKRALDLDDALPSVLNGYAKCLTQLGKYEESNRTYNEILNGTSKIDDRAVLYTNMGRNFIKLALWTRALNFLNKALEADTSYKEAYIAQTEVLYNIGRHKDAMECIDKLIKMYPLYFQGYMQKGACYRYMKSYDESLKMLKKAQELAKGLEANYTLNMELGRTYEALKKYDTAYKYYQQAVSATNSVLESDLATARIGILLGKVK
ncbi:MAG: tetratricopeptide repeat protein [Ignavibacteria bacterium]|jgi:tetratricopeptide (TPR) repeat protein|nr:tetratricopeptide repeat protein [Ignavibacteria bacterium]